MKNSDKAQKSQMIDNQLFGIDFHNFMEMEPSNTMFELASEFGLTVRDIKALKKKLERS